MSRQKALRSFPVSADSFLDDWARKSADPLLRRSLGETFESAGRIWGLLPDTWKLDSPAFLDIVRDKLVAAGILTSARFSEGDIDGATKTWRPAGIEFSNIVYCTGIQHRIVTGSANADRDLLFYGVAGERVELNLEGLDPQMPRLPDGSEPDMLIADITVSRGQQDGTVIFGAGSSYRRKLLPAGTEPSSALELARKAVKLLCDLEATDEALSARITKTLWGIRPASRDRRPYIGPLPGVANAYVLNGLGTRGFLAAPHCARVLVDFLVDGADIPVEYSPARLVV